MGEGNTSEAIAVLQEAVDWYRTNEVRATALVVGKVTSKVTSKVASNPFLFSKSHKLVYVCNCDFQLSLWSLRMTML